MARTATTPRLNLLPAALAVLCIALSLIGIMFGVRVERANADLQRRHDAVEVGRAAALYLTTVDYRDIDSTANRVLDLSVGDFRDSYAAQMRQLETLISKATTTAEGSVLEVGVVRATPKAVRLLVAADSRSTTVDDASGSIQQYRMQVDLVRDEGRWLVSDVAFVS